MRPLTFGSAELDFEDLLEQLDAAHVDSGAAFSNPQLWMSDDEVDTLDEGSVVENHDHDDVPAVRLG